MSVTASGSRTAPTARSRGDGQGHSRLGGGRALRFQNGAQVRIGDEVDVLDGSRDRPGAQDGGQVGVGLIGGARVDESEHGVQPVRELVPLSAQGPSHRSDGLELASHRQHLGLVPQGHDPADRDPVALDPHRCCQQNPVADGDPPPQGSVRRGVGHERGDLIGHIDEFVV